LIEAIAREQAGWAKGRATADPFDRVIGGAMPKKRVKRTAKDVRIERLEQSWEEREHKEREAALAVIAEFGGKKPEGRLLIPEQDPANDKVKMALAGEVLLLRHEFGRVIEFIESIRRGEPFAFIAHGPLGPRRKGWK
jgi:hypothetical protein